MSTFNMFEVLSKDDKELIHSAFVAFALNHSVEFKNTLLGCVYQTNFILERDLTSLVTDRRMLNETKTQLEKHGRKQTKIDLISDNGEQICIIENKFKHQPDLSQLLCYNIVLDRIPRSKKTCILLCFDSACVDIPNGWKTVTYAELTKMLKDHRAGFTGHEGIFLDHYIEFVTRYCSAYAALLDEQNTLRKFLVNTLEDTDAIYTGNRNFWLRLLYGRLSIIINKTWPNHFICDYTGKGTNVAVLDIKPIQWDTLTKKEKDSCGFYIQVQNNTMKCCFWVTHNTFMTNRDIAVLAYNELKLKYGQEQSIKVSQPPDKDPGNKRDTMSFTICSRRMVKLNTLSECADEIGKFYCLINQAIMKL